MGNCFGKEEKKGGNFGGAGRTLGSAPQADQNARATVPAAAKRTFTGESRTLGGANTDENDARAAAAQAAEVCMN
jgi:hypothetical protein